jgi:hypothetical protein
MKPERANIRSDDVAEIWQTAQLRRTQDLGLWMTELFRRRPQADGFEPIFSPLPRILTAYGGTMFRSLVSRSNALADIAGTKP